MQGCLYRSYRFRGNKLPIIDLRQLLGIPLLEKEYLDFEAMVEYKKCSIIKLTQEWSQYFEKSELTEPKIDWHINKFDKWYDNYIFEKYELASCLKKIEELYKKSQLEAEKAVKYKLDYDGLRMDVDLYTALVVDVQKCVTEIVELFDKAKKFFYDCLQKNVTVISDGNNKCGILVDEILFITNLQQADTNKSLLGIKNQSIISFIAQVENNSQLIVVLDASSILSMSTIS